VFHCIPAQLGNAGHGAKDSLGRSVVASVRNRFGDNPAALRLELAPPGRPAQEAEVHVLDHTPLDPSLWVDADDEGVRGYHGGSGR